MGDSHENRRSFLKAATLGVGGAIGAALAYPLVRYFFFPVGKKTVSSSSEPVDVLAADSLAPGADPVRVTIVASSIRDAWNTVQNVPLGAAYVRKTDDGEIEALSSVCPHLGCSVEYAEGADEYRCPCHKSAFAIDGGKLSGPSKRGMDPLPVKVEDGRVKVTFIRYRTDVSGREPV